MHSSSLYISCILLTTIFFLLKTIIVRHWYFLSVFGIYFHSCDILAEDRRFDVNVVYPETIFFQRKIVTNLRHMKIDMFWNVRRTPLIFSFIIYIIYALVIQIMYICMNYWNNYTSRQRYNVSYHVENLRFSPYEFR